MYRSSDVCILWWSNFVLASWFLTPCTSFPVLPERSHTQHSAQVSLYPETDYHTFATLENSLLGCGPCLAQVSLRSMKQNSDPTLDSPSRMQHPNLTKKFALRSVGFLTPNMPTSASLAQVLLRFTSPELSSTRCSASNERKRLQENIEKFLMSNK